VAVLVIGRDNGLIKSVNRRVCRDLGLPAEEIAGQNYRKIFRPEFISVYERLAAGCEDGQEHTVLYYWAEMALWEQISARVIQLDSRPHTLMSVTQITESARSKYRAESVAYFDNLLKLPNGRKLEEDINELASVETVTLIYLVLERFEDINNLYGWDNGDRLLKQVRDWLLTSETRRAQLYRVDNGFAVLGRHATLEEAEDRSREILERFSRPWSLPAGANRLSLYCTIKLGIVSGQYVRNEMRNLLLRTIRTAKKSAAGYSVYDEQADREAKRSIRCRDSLITCIFNGMQGFEVRYQPIVELETGRWRALEALCRWTMPDGTEIEPSYFIGLAEHLALIERLDSWVRATAMRQCVALGLDRRDFVLNVNFSPTQSLDDLFIAGLLKSLGETGFPPDKLNLEITESARMNFDEKTITGLRRLKENGIILTLDDFGTGYSSFANLTRVPADSLKTEKLFLDDLVRDRHGQYFMRTLADMAHYLGLKMIAEGVETREQLEVLRGFQVDYAQGYLFSRPLSYEELRQESRRF
jgi:PAS domain S-box-containing protein